MACFKKKLLGYSDHHFCDFLSPPEVCITGFVAKLLQNQIFHSLLAIMEKIMFLETRRNKKNKLLWIFTGLYMYFQSSLQLRDYTEMRGEGRKVLIFIFKCVSLSIRGFLIISISFSKWHCWVPCKGYSWIWGFAFLTQSLLAFAKCLALYSYLSLTMMKVKSLSHLWESSCCAGLRLNHLTVAHTVAWDFRNILQPQPICIRFLFLPVLSQASGWLRPCIIVSDLCFSPDQPFAGSLRHSLNKTVPEISIATCVPPSWLCFSNYNIWETQGVSGAAPPVMSTKIFPSRSWWKRSRN